MPFRVVDPSQHTITLKELDPEGDTFIIFREATFAEAKERQDYFAETKVEYDDEQVGKMTRITHWSQGDMQLLEVWLTLVDCNIEDSDGAKLLKPHSSMSYDTFKVRAGKLRPSQWTEIHKACLQVNPDWDFTRESGEKS
jgi:hypothetical protein